MVGLPFQYLYWHYTKAVRSYIVIAQTLLWYVGHIFSIGFLLRTLFAPWKRRDQVYAGGGIEQYAEAVVVSFLSRVVGVVIKLPIIIFGSVVWCGALISLGLGFVGWLVAPFILVLMTLFASYMFYAYV